MTVLASPGVLAEERDTIGRYELLLELGRGGMAVLYLARVVGPAGFTRLFAIKRILPHLVADPVFVDMFLAEGRIAAHLMHPNLCTVWELGQHRGELFLAMDYLDGVAWETLVAAAPRDHRGLALAAGVLAQACDGLHHAHTFRDAGGTALSIVHRDVSPQNLFVSRDGTCRVLDFGVSKIASDPRRTRSGVRKGKLPYMAPEQVRGDAVDARTDVWAIGVVLWEALVGRHLFDRETDFLTYQHITAGDIPSVNVDGAHYPAAADRVIARALARDPKHRHPTARDLARDLADLGASVGGAASRDTIADSLAALCAPQLAARQQAIAAALARPPPGETSDATAVPAGGAPDDTAADRDAAATVSMAMRRDAIVVGASRDDTSRDADASDDDAAATAAMSRRRDAIVVGNGSRDDSPPSARHAAAIERDAAATAELFLRRDAAATVDMLKPREPRGSRPPRGRWSRRGPWIVAGLGLVAVIGAVLLALAISAGPPRPTPVASSLAPPRPPDSPPADRPGGGSTAGPVPTASPAASVPPSTASPASPVPPSAASPSVASSPGPTPSPALASRPRAAAPHPAAREQREPGAAGLSATGWYGIDSSPYATIFIDDHKIGDTPLYRVRLRAGSHRIRAVLADGRQRSFAIDIAADRETSSGTLAW